MLCPSDCLKRHDRGTSTEASGSRNMQTRAQDKAALLRFEYQRPTLDTSVLDALNAFVAKSQEEISPSLA